MQALSSTHANFERHAQHHLPNYGRERAPSSASLHPDLSGGHLAQVALLQGGPPGPRGQPHHWSEELGDISFWPLLQYSTGKTLALWCDLGELGNFSFHLLLDPKMVEF